jgi:hypothetical protein
MSTRSQINSQLLGGEQGTKNACIQSSSDFTDLELYQLWLYLSITFSPSLMDVKQVKPGQPTIN